MSTWMSPSFFYLHLSEYYKGIIDKQGAVMLTDKQCRTDRPKEKLNRLNDFDGLNFEVKPNCKRHGAIDLNSTENRACLRWVNTR